MNGASIRKNAVRTLKKETVWSRKWLQTKMLSSFCAFWDNHSWPETINLFSIKCQRIQECVRSLTH